eukprot:tig00000615_g2585.t1
MFIEKIVLDGFKSYATHTEIVGFDPHFNAITGLNGSGKSNILDAVCFVLGITNLQQVRAGNLQELIYKQGQAGVNKASVSIEFNNQDKRGSPIGFEGDDKITVTRVIALSGGKVTGKYFINGRLAQQNSVQNLFQSVQLNVNNPHFLIMQGRITKVLNMKPPEILGMVEEAAGTRMFEAKKEAAAKTMEKKEKKIEEINKILSEDITPTLERLRKERQEYMQWSQNTQELERLERFCTAFNFVKAQELLEKFKLDVMQLQEQEAKLQEEQKQITETIKALDAQIKELMSSQSDDGDESLKELEESSTKLSKEVVLLESQLKNKKDNLKNEEKNAGKIEKQLAELEKLEKQKAAELEKAAKQQAEFEEKCKALQSEVEELQMQFQAASAGIAVAVGEKSLPDQLAEAKKAALDLETGTKQTEMHLALLKDQLKEKMTLKQAAEKDVAQMSGSKASLQSDLEKLESNLAKIGFDENSLNALRKEKATQEEKVAQLREAAGALSAQLGDMDFQYQDPENGFNRARVKGIIANLVEVKNPIHSVALEVAAGSRLFQVVVDTETTGKLLLEKGQIKKRVTIIPLNKIDSRTISDKALRAAENTVGADRVNVALSLVGYDSEVKAAMQYVFGNTLVCKDSDAAQKVTFNREVNTVSVTLEGDRFDPAGTLTGGSRGSNGNVLGRLVELNSKREELRQAEAALQKTSQLIQEAEKKLKVFQQASRERDLKKRELELVHERIASSSPQQILDQIQSLESQSAADAERLKEYAVEKKKLAEKIAKLEREITDFHSSREDHVKRLENLVKTTKQKLVGAVKSSKDHDLLVERITAERDDLQKERESLFEQQQASTSASAQLSSALRDAESVLEQKKKEHQEASSSLEKAKARVAERNKEIAQHKKEQDSLKRKLADHDIELKKMGVKRNETQTHCDNVVSRIEDMQKEHPWIDTDRHLFGKPHTDFDFAAKNPAQQQQRLKNLQEENTKLSRKVNKRAMGMFEKSEAEYHDLISKKQIIENDKKKIQSVIKELEVKKKEALRATWVKVNKDFGSIFSTLLPGTDAKLDPVEDKGNLIGLEVRVAFGGVWKESLTELSGGQRSLLALSLILAMLLFKPAPMYILDEVDAALDLSHTQNIGQMIKSHFTHSQFLVVSLKEGMFNNANVIFRTKFVDGVSTVTRTVPSVRRGA